jgi:signal peptidase I
MWLLRIIWDFVIDFLQTIVVSLSIFALVYLFLFQPHQVDGRSMDPTLDNGQYLLTDKVSYRFTDPKAGDIVVFHSPHDATIDFIKRIVATPGDTVMIKGGYMHKNGVKLDEFYLNDPGEVAQGKFLREGLEVEVPPGQYLVMGDNRLHSSDSREWGFITPSMIVGKAFFRYWPFTDLGPIDTTQSAKALAQ